MKKSEMFYEYAESKIKNISVSIQCADKNDEEIEYTKNIWIKMKSCTEILSAYENSCSTNERKQFVIAWNYFMAVVAELNGD
jgi:hypothetical protein